MRRRKVLVHRKGLRGRCSHRSVNVPAMQLGSLGSALVHWFSQSARWSQWHLVVFLVMFLGTAQPARELIAVSRSASESWEYQYCKGMNGTEAKIAGAFRVIEYFWHGSFWSQDSEFPRYCWWLLSLWPLRKSCPYACNAYAKGHTAATAQHVLARDEIWKWIHFEWLLMWRTYIWCEFE